MTADLFALRDQVCATANVHSLAVEAGFDASGQRRDWYRHGSADKSASAHKRGDGLYCFHCSKFFSVIDLAMLRDGHHDFVKALHALADENGLEWQRLSVKERKQKRAEAQRAKSIAADTVDWISGVNIIAMEKKAVLIEAAEECWAMGADTLGDAIAAMVEQIPRAALSPEAADPALIVRAYRSCALSHPEATPRVLRLGREIRENAARITEAIVGLLAESQPSLEKAA